MKNPSKVHRHVPLVAGSRTAVNRLLTATLNQEAQNRPLSTAAAKVVSDLILIFVLPLSNIDPAFLLDLQEIPFHRVGHYHNYFIVCFISIIKGSEEYVNQSTFEFCRRESLYCIQNTRTVTKPV